MVRVSDSFLLNFKFIITKIYIFNDEKYQLLGRHLEFLKSMKYVFHVVRNTNDQQIDWQLNNNCETLCMWNIENPPCCAFYFLFIFVDIWKNTPVTSHGYWSLNSRKWIKNRIAFKIWTALSYFATIHWREVCQQYPWLVTGVFFHMYMQRERYNQIAN